MKWWTLSRCLALSLAWLIIFVAGASAYTTPRLKPPPPPPAYLTPADHERLEAVLDAIDHRDWRRAEKVAATVDDPIAGSLANWFYFNAEDPSVDITQADEFLDTHPDWPSVSKIQSHVEQRIPNTASPDLILAFFDTREPITGDGKLQMTRALFAKGEREAAVIHLRDAWINHTFSVSDEKRLLARYGDHLRPSDHTSRVDRLLWARQVTNARRVFSRLKSQDRRKAEARSALLLRASSGPRLYNALPKDDRLDSGVLLAAVRYYRRTGDEERAISLALQAPATPDALRNPARWWSERQLLMRWALKNGRFTDAYSMAAGHGLAPDSNYAEAEFDAGWIAFRFLNAPERAEVHFKALSTAVSSPISTARAYYWLGRTAEARGAPELATVRYNRAAEHIYTYYGQIAAEKLGGVSVEAKFAPPTLTSPMDSARFSSRPVVAALRMLSDLDRDQNFLVFAYKADDQLETPGEYVELAKLADRSGATHVSVRAGKAGIMRGAFAPDVAYPLIFVPEEVKNFTAPEVVLGLSRQESEFNPRAYSSAGARGLMQLIPSTAQLTARKVGIRYSRSALLDDPTYNMMLGSAHLSDLLERFDDSFVMTFAAYNAGPNRVDRWVEEYGDPRDPNIDPLDWVELIPFSETRNYVQRVLENTQIYRARLGDQPIAGRLTADLERGGPRGRTGGDTQVSPVLLLAAAEIGPQTLPPLPVRTQPFVTKSNQSTPTPSILPTVKPSPFKTPEATLAPAQNPESKLFQIDNAQPNDAPNRPRQPLIEENPVTPQNVEQSPSSTSAEILPGISGTASESVQSSINNAPNVKRPQPIIVKPTPATMTSSALPISAPPEQPVTDNISGPDIAMTQPCQTYRDFIIENAEGEPSAADLNASSFAELLGGGSSCN